MIISSRIARLIAASVMALLAVVAAFGLLYRLPMWLLGLSEPWELRSTNDHLVADTIGVGLLVFALVTLPALAKVFYLAWSPRPTVGSPTTVQSIDGTLPEG